MDFRWTIAKTYPDAPHEYVLRHQQPEAFEFYQKELREAGVEEEFTLRGRSFIYRCYYGGDGYKYLINRDVLNRARVAAAETEPGMSGPPTLWMIERHAVISCARHASGASHLAGRGGGG